MSEARILFLDQTQSSCTGADGARARVQNITFPSDYNVSIFQTACGRECKQVNNGLEGQPRWLGGSSPLHQGLLPLYPHLERGGALLLWQIG